jgi:hypothetical protein
MAKTAAPARKKAEEPKKRSSAKKIAVKGNRNKRA